MTTVLEKAAPEELADLVSIYQKQMGAYLAANQNFFAKNLGLGGSLANAESTFRWLAAEKGDHSNMDTACVPLAFESLAIIKRNKPEGWSFGRLTIGMDSFVEHNAAIMWKTGQHWKTGTVFDAWVEQKPKIFSYPVWWLKFYLHSALGEPRVSEQR